MSRAEVVKITLFAVMGAVLVLDAAHMLAQGPPGRIITGQFPTTPQPEVLVLVDQTSAMSFGAFGAAASAIGAVNPRVTVAAMLGCFDASWCLVVTDAMLAGQDAHAALGALAQHEIDRHAVR